MSWPSTDFELEIQNELDSLRADNERLRAGIRAVLDEDPGHHECTVALEKLAALVEGPATQRHGEEEEG